MKLRLAFAAAAVVLAGIAVGGPGAPAPALAVPANDNLANAIPITTPARSGIVATGSNVGASTEGSENLTPCATMGKTVWYSWTSPGTPGTVVFDTWGNTAGITGDTVLAIYTGSAYPLSQVGCNDDAFGSNRPSAVTLSYAASTTYRIQVGTFGDSFGGDIVLNMALGAAVYVNSASDTDVRDTVMTLREAMSVADGALSYAALSATEQTFVRNASAAGIPGSDLIHFAPVNFPTDSPASINLASQLPDMNQTGDVISGVGAGVKIDGQNATGCLPLTGAFNHVEGLWIRRCLYGAIGIYGDANSVGGALSIQRNILTESQNGIVIGVYGAATNTVVKGNYIGTDGVADLGMVGVDTATGHGILNTATGTVVGGPLPGEGNVISGNDLGVGVVITDSANTVIHGNKIGTDGSGAAAIPNGVGVWIGTLPGTAFGPSTNTQVGSPTLGYGNIIAFNGSYGIAAVDSNATIHGNSIHSNGDVGIFNAYPPQPAVPTVSSVAGGTVSGFACANCTVDLYNDLADQGRAYLGSATANGSGAFSATGVAHALPNITATSTNLSGFTSNFSAPVAAPPNSDGDGLPDAADGCPFDPEDVDGFEDGDGCPDTDNDVDGVPDVSDTGKTCFDPAGTLSCLVIDCRNMAEDYDAFKDSDGCPEPDNDNDGFPDHADNCPGTGLLAGPDGMLGSPQDLNHNGIKDVAEATLTTDDVVKTFEDYDTVLDVDGCHDSPGEDFDGDGFTDDAETLTIGTDAGYPCGYNSWPADLWDQPPLSANKVTVQDLTAFIAPVRRLGTSPGDADFNARWDLLPGKGIFSATINVQDMTAIVTLTPPMLNGARALNGPSCPMPSQ